MDEKIVYIPEEEQKKLDEFERNYVAQHPGETGCYHNIYHLVSEDRDGNITGEAFGINVMTDLGFSRAYLNSDDYYQTTAYMYLGDGDTQNTDIDPASSSMIHLISSTSATITDANWSYSGGKWIPEKESTREQYRLVIGYFDYTVWSEDHEVTEIGLCTREYTSPTQLRYHAAVYNSQGQKTSFWKRVNEKLTITVYGRYMFPIVKIVNSSWDKGIPLAVRPYSFFQRKAEDYWSYISGKYSAYWNTQYSNITTSWANSVGFRYRDSGSITDHIWSSRKSLGINIFMDNFRQNLSEMVFGTYQDTSYRSYYDSYFVCPVKIYSPDPIPFQRDNFSTSGQASLSLSSTYATRSGDFSCDPAGQLSCTNVNISSIRMFNAQTNDWDIDIPFIQTPDLDMSYRHLRFSIRAHNYITFQNAYKWYTVFINDAPQYPIKSITNAGRTFYVTDAYWDSSTWEIVPNNGNISREQGSKRFFIMFEEQFDYDSDDSNRWYGDERHTRKVTRYDYSWPQLVLNTGPNYPNGCGSDTVNYGLRTGASAPLYWESGQYQGKAIQNETIGYIAQDGFLVYPDSINPNPGIKYYQTPTYSGNLEGVPYIYHLGGVDLTYESDGISVGGTYRDGSHFGGFIWNTTRGTHIACMGYNSYRKGYRVYTPNADPSIPPTYQDFRFDTAYNADSGWSHTNNGYCVTSWMTGNNANITYVLEYDAVINGEPVAPNMYKVEGYHHGFAIDLTSYFVAIDSSVTDHLHMVIYDMENREVHDEFDIPEGYSFAGIAGWKNWIYVRVNLGGAISTYVYHIREQVLELTPLNVGQMIWDTSSWNSHVQRAVEANGNIESCMVLVASDRDCENQYHVLIKESDPTHVVSIIRRSNYETSSFVRYQKAWLGYSSDNKQLLLTIKTRRSICIDIGYVLKRGTQNTMYTWKYDYNEQGRYSCPIYYKGFIYLMTLYYYDWWGSPYSRYTNQTYYYRRNLPQYLDTLQITGTTLTPNAMMNPVRVQGTVMTAFMSATNRDVDVAPEPYVPPEEEEEDPTL